MFFLRYFLIPAVSAVWYDNTGTLNPTADSSTINLQYSVVYFNPPAYTNAPYNGTLLITGYSGYQPNCAASIVKSWKGTVPPSDLNVVAITSGSCIFNTNRQTTILANIDVPDSGYNSLTGFKFRQYTNIASNSYWQPRLINSTKLKRINFAVQNIIDVAIIQLNMKAIDLYNEGFRFYNLAKTSLAVNSPIVNVGFFNSNPETYYMRTMTGLIQNTNVSYSSSFGGSITHSLGHSSNEYSTGSPILSNADSSTIYAIATEHGNLATGFNYGFPVNEIATCFNDNGLFTMNSANCLSGFKLEWLGKYGQSVDGLRYIPLDSNQISSATVVDITSQAMANANATNPPPTFDTYVEQVKWSNANRIQAGLFWLFGLLILY